MTLSTSARIASELGVLVPIGGGYSAETVRRFGGLLPGDRSIIAVVPSACAYSGLPNAVEQADLIARITGHVARVVPLLVRADSFVPAHVAVFDNRRLGGIFFLGGNQDEAMAMLVNTPVEAAMDRAFARGVVVGGTSAGDAVESHTMIAGPASGFTAMTGLRRKAVDVWWADDLRRRGLCFGSRHVVLDSHFHQRGRMGRLLSVVARSADRFGSPLLGVGIDTQTGTVLSNDRLLGPVFGQSSITIVDMENAAHRWAGRSQTLAARGIRIHLLAAGDGATYDLERRAVWVHGVELSAASQPWSVQSSARGTVLLSGGKAPLRLLIARARAGGRPLIQILSPDFPAAERALRAAGWSGQIEQLTIGDTVSGALLLIGVPGTRLGSAKRAALRLLVTNAPLVALDGTMSAALGSYYVAGAPPSPGQREAAAIISHRADGVVPSAGLGVLTAGVATGSMDGLFWGRLYALSRVRPDAAALGLSAASYAVCEAGKMIVGGGPVVALNGRVARYRVGATGTLAAYNLILDVYVPGECLPIQAGQGHE